jgi:hypothetical protein
MPIILSIVTALKDLVKLQYIKEYEYLNIVISDKNRIE